MNAENVSIQITEKARAAMFSALESVTEESRMFHIFMNGYG